MAKIGFCIFIQENENFQEDCESILVEVAIARLKSIFILISSFFYYFHKDLSPNGKIHKNQLQFVINL